MKQLVFVCAVLLCAETAVGQGTILFGNAFTGTFRAPIYGQEPGNATLSLSGQSSQNGGLPTGGTVYNGPLLSGTGYTFALFAGPTGSAENALTLVTTTTFRTGTAIPAGLVYPTVATINGVAPGQIATLQIRVWDNQGGCIVSWAQVLASGTPHGMTALFQSLPLGESGNPAAPAPESSGWSSFNLVGDGPGCVPEPSVIALGFLGCFALMVRKLRPRVSSQSTRSTR